MTQKEINQKAKKASQAIIDGTFRRRGFRQEWEEFDKDIQKEIQKEMIEIIKQNFLKAIDLE